MREHDISGQRFGRLVAIARHDKPRAWRWLCRCDCGNEKAVGISQLRAGVTKSCGCLRVDTTREKFTTHGRTGTLEHGIWKGIRARCLNPNTKAYPYYGGRGIKICDRWRDSFADFIADMGPRPSLEHSVDRIDVNGDYCKDNCRWATDEVQAANTRTYLLYRENTRLRLENARLSAELENLKREIT